MLLLLPHSLYLAISIAPPCGSPHAARSAGSFQDKPRYEPLADLVNHPLVVGFYLINFGYVSLALKLGYDVEERSRGNRKRLAAESRHGACCALWHALLSTLYIFQP